MTALRVGVQLHGYVGCLQSHVVAQRVLDAVNVIVLILQEESRWGLRGDMTLDVGIQRDAVLG